MPTKRRPKNLDLTTIKLPLSALVSILHRISGVLLFLLVPLGLLALHLSLVSKSSFDALLNFIQNPISKLFMLFFFWAGFHHIFAGLRHLAIDFRWSWVGGKSFPLERVVIISSLMLTLISGIVFW